MEWTGYGREAAEALRAVIARTKADEPLAPVTVVVPSNHVGVAARRLLASGALGPTCNRGTGLVAVSFMTPYRLAELVGAPALAATGRRPVSTPVVAAALRASLADQPGLFAPVAQHPATETALVAAYRELREVSPHGLDAIARKGARAHDVVRLHRATRERLEPGWYDEQDLMSTPRSRSSAAWSTSSPPRRSSPWPSRARTRSPSVVPSTAPRDRTKRRPAASAATSRSRRARTWSTPLTPRQAPRASLASGSAPEELLDYDRSIDAWVG